MLIANNQNYNKLEIQNARLQNLASPPSSPVTGQIYYDTSLGQTGVYQVSTWVYLGGGGGTVTSVSVVSANGFTGTVATATSTPAITIATSITGLLKGNGTALSAATSGTDYSLGTSALTTGILKSTTSTGALSIAVAGDFPTLNQNTSGTSALATNLAGGSGGQVHYQSAANTTAFLANGTAGYILQSNGTTLAPSWVLAPAGGDMLLSGIQTVTGAKTFNSAKLILAGSTSGTTILNAAAVAGSTTLTLPSANDTLIGKATTDTLTNKTFDANGTGNSISNIETADFAVNVIDTDTTLAANSDTRIASQKATKAYIDSIAASEMTFKGGIDASANPNYPAAIIGDVWRITVAGLIGGGSGIPVTVGDTIISAGTAVAGNQATVGANWTILQANVDLATTSVQGIVTLATQAEAQAKSNSTKALTAASVADFARVYTTLIGNGSSTSLAVTHGLGSQYVHVQVYDASSGALILVDVTLTSSTVATVIFAVAPSTNAYRVVVIG